ncbi:MAG: hypothetical protein AUJ92_12485 [Armatimonadetes bacterium CG2_30_59_28]|nr:MAG: hypothetical protein AUJ92_12485 [Armatimonadetes bacterium CG2_30_59_28]
MFTGEALTEIAFPLGGIGTGTISLGGRGNLRDWEIYNRPNKGSLLPYTFFALWARKDGEAPVASILESALQPPFVAGGGLRPDTLPGVRRMQSATFRGEYPFAWIEFGDEALPVRVSLEAFNPFMPLNVEDSSIPAAIFQWKLTNPSTRPVEVSLTATMHNPVAFQVQDEETPRTDGEWRNEYRETANLRGLLFASTRFDEKGCNSGTATLTTTHVHVTAQTLWYQAGWWDGSHLFWDKFAAEGQLQTCTDPAVVTQGKPVSSLALHATIPPRKSVTLPVMITWHTPFMKNAWARQALLGTYMSRQFRDAWHVAAYTANNIDRLHRESSQWHNAIFGSSLPSSVIDAVTSQASIIRTQTCVRLADGNFYAYEGCGDKDGCCAGNCIHVWNYEQALAFLFPELERSMRRTDFANVQPNGSIPFRTGLPNAAPPANTFPCVDGQMGTIIQAYRDWQLSGDDPFIRGIWPNLKKALEFAWTGPGGAVDSRSPHVGQNQGTWDPNKDGLMEGVQHNTYDIEFYGPNTMLGAMYLGALRAAEEIARHLGEENKADEYRAVYESGRALTEEELWNGEYYIQKVQVLPGEEIPEHLRTPASPCCEAGCSCNDIEKTSALSTSAPFPKYQYGDGCLSDQLLGQWASHVAGIGHVLDPERVRKTMESIFRNNWKPRMDTVDSVQRIYALNDEAGLLLCSWPQGNRPTLPFVYCDEVWTGIEYQVAAHLIYEGLVDEGLAIVKGVRDRHDGIRRNPWNEFECGHHYARALASWSVLLALSGHRYSAVSHSLAFSPQVHATKFNCVFSTGEAWGVFSQESEGNVLKACLSVEKGVLSLRRLDLTWPATRVPASLTAEARIGRDRVPVQLMVSATALTLTLPAGLTLSKGQPVRWTMKKGERGRKDRRARCRSPIEGSEEATQEPAAESHPNGKELEENTIFGDRHQRDSSGDAVDRR